MVHSCAPDAWWMQQSDRCMPVSQSDHHLQPWGSCQQKYPVIRPAGVATWEYPKPYQATGLGEFYLRMKVSLSSCVWPCLRWRKGYFRGEAQGPADGQEDGGCWGSTSRAEALSAGLNPPEDFLEPFQAPLWMLQCLCSGKGLWRRLSNWEVWIAGISLFILPCFPLGSSSLI